MSSQSAQERAAGQQSQWQADLARQLSDIAQPQLSQLMGNLSGILGDVNASGRLGLDANVLSSARNELNQGYGRALFGNNEFINYAGLRSGEGRLSPGAMNSSLMSAATNLERDRATALRNLEFQSAQSSLADYNQVLSLLGQGSQTALGLAGGFSGASNAALGGLSQTSQLGGALGGAASGAALGSYLGAYGALAGGVIGGVAGGFGVG